ncbi:MAG: hypothetical protein HKN47_04935 [Pirellulaceae bacterium]|nr:hypothetical protein [Pirellulaceae bacterium]
MNPKVASVKSADSAAANTSPSIGTPPLGTPPNVSASATPPTAKPAPKPVAVPQTQPKAAVKPKAAAKPKVASKPKAQPKPPGAKTPPAAGAPQLNLGEAAGGAKISAKPGEPDFSQLMGLGGKSKKVDAPAIVTTDAVAPKKKGDWKSRGKKLSSDGDKE